MDKRSPPTSETRVRFPYSPLTCVEFVVGYRLAPRLFNGFERLSPSTKKKTLLNSNSIWTSISATGLLACSYTLSK